MKVNFQINPSCALDVEVKDVKQAFSFVAYAQEVFGQTKCGNCGSPNLKLRHRTPSGYEYFSVQCQDCHHELKFGQQKDSGRLFPKGWEPPYSEGKQSGGQRDEYQEPAPGRRQYQDEIEF